MSEQNIWMEEAKEIAIQCWCDIETEHIKMDPFLCEAVAKRISTWMEITEQNSQNTEYYRGLLVKCGKYIGKQSYISDDGCLSNSVLCGKIPELVKIAFEDKKKDLKIKNKKSDYFIIKILKKLINKFIELIYIGATHNNDIFFDYEKAKKLGLTDLDRWQDGIEHHLMSKRLMTFLKEHDFNDYDDHFCWKTGGDGDNGDNLMYQMDAFFETIDK